MRHEAFPRAASRPSGDVADHPGAYLATIAQNLTIDADRRLRVQGGPALALDGLPEASQP